MQPLAFFIFAEKYRCENGWSTTPRFISFPLRAFWSMILWRKRPERKDEMHEFPVWNVHEAHGRSTAVGRNAPSRTQTIILQVASRDEKRFNASVHVQWTRLVHSRSLRLRDQHRKCHGWLHFFAVPDLQPDQRDCTATYTKTANSKTVETSGLRNRLLKTRWFPRWFL